MYQPLNISFQVPEILQQNIDEFLYNLNQENGSLRDCYEAEIRNILNSCVDCEGELTEDQIEHLRNYYCRGGVYESDH